MIGSMRMRLLLALVAAIGLTELGVSTGCDGDGDGDADAEVDVEWNVDLDKSAQASWEVCVGAAGECTDDCCPDTFGRTISTTEGVQCEVRAAGSGYELSFSMASTEESQPALAAEALAFDSLSSALMPVTSCARFRVTEYGSNYPTSQCVEVDETTAVQPGQCAIEVNIDTYNTVAGRFRCIEIGADPTLTTIYDSAPGDGEFLISGCRFTR